MVKIDRTIKKEWAAGLSKLKQLIGGNKDGQLENDEGLARAYFFLMDLGKKEMDPNWEASWFNSALVNQVNVIKELVKNFNENSKAEINRLIVIGVNTASIKGEDRKKWEQRKKTIQEANKETSDDELNINTRKLIQEYEHEAKLERVLTISKMPISDGPDLRMEEPDSEQQMKKEDCAELSVSPHVTLTTSVGRPKSENSGNIQEDDYRRVCIYTQQELDARIRQIEQSFKHKDKKEQRHQLYKWIITLAIAIILAALAGIILYEQFSRMAPTDVEQTAVNPFAIEGAYSMTHIVNGTRDPQPMQAAIKHNGGEDYTIALISEYDPEMYDLSICNDGTAFSSVLGEGKLVPSLSGMIIIELVKGNETWKFMK